jgi:hypothetical protein
MRRLACCAGVILVWLSATGVLAGDFDGSKLLICASIQAMDCAPGEDCIKELPEDVGVPAFMRLDFANKAVIGPKRTSAMLLVEKNEHQILLQGTELGYGWTIVLDQVEGKMSVTLAHRDRVVVIFGACMPL